MSQQYPGPQQPYHQQPHPGQRPYQGQWHYQGGPAPWPPRPPKNNLPTPAVVAIVGVIVAFLGVLLVGALLPSDHDKATPLRFKDHTGQSIKTASASLEKADLYVPQVRDARNGDEVRIDEDDWKICFQHPKTGTRITDTFDFTATFSAVPPHTACPDKDGERVRMPRVTGLRLDKAVDRLTTIGTSPVSDNAYDDEPDPEDGQEKKFTVCFQSPKPGSPLDTGPGSFHTTFPDLYALPNGEHCPDKPGTKKNPEPAPPSDTSDDLPDLPHIHRPDLDKPYLCRHTRWC
ncbi:PASTA domain-containing protein [Streptomyces sp. NPDC102364]|uniref:PASTA domain-containing protein n=1 Tax=Streptomyces sp. NPDC102364 TaxID=3366161 RepID=UPI0037FF2EDD